MINKLEKFWGHRYEGNDKTTCDIENLRSMIKVLNGCHETFNMSHTLEELCILYAAMQQCKWDVMPDHWMPWQITRALELGEVPEFRDWDKDDMINGEETLGGYHTDVVPVYPEGYAESIED